MPLLAGKNIVVTGVLAQTSIAYHVANIASREGAHLIFTSFSRHSLIQRLASRLTPSPVIVNLDVTNAEDTASLASRIGEHVDRVDGILHSIAFAPKTALGGNFLSVDWEDVATTLEVSAFSFKSIAMALQPLMPAGSSIVGLDFDASRAWRGYDWMGVAKACLESCARYLALYLGPEGVRVNLVAAGPLRTIAAQATYSSDADSRDFERAWADSAPLGWESTGHVAVARACVALLSDWFPATTGEVVHVDGGVHAVG
jgi:enoyl-[acyl-carrier protein] reductase I